MTARTTRRQLFGASAAMLLVGSAGAGEAKARELDGELLAACDAFQRVHAVSDAMNIKSGVTDEESDANLTAWIEARENLVEAPAPRTPEGLQAKAHAAFLALRERHCVQAWQIVPWRDQVGDEALLALECLAAVAGIEA